MKKIAIDIRSVSGARAGKGNYTFEMLKALLKLDQENKYLLYSKEDVKDFVEAKNVELKIINSKGFFWHGKVAKDCKKMKVDFFWSPSSYITPSLMDKSIKTIITVHDLVAFLRISQHNRKALILEKFFLKNAAKKAVKILAVSESTKKDLIDFAPFLKDKIAVAYCAVDDRFKAKKFNVKKDFFLAVGTIQPRKNYLNLIDAFAIYQKDKPNLKLKIIGKNGWDFQAVYQKIEELDLKNSVEIMGYIKENQLIKLYCDAIALVFPSFYEGFGIPLLEAMKCACPVICSKNSSIPEVVGDAALFINEKKAQDIANKMMELDTNHHLREDLIKKGLEQAKKFSWEISAKRLLNILNEA